MLLRKLLENIAPLFDPMDGGGGLLIRRFTRRSDHPENWGVISGWPADDLLAWSDNYIQADSDESGLEKHPLAYP